MSRDAADMQTMGFRNEEDVREYNDSNCSGAHKAEATSRDAEIESLRQQLELKHQECISFYNEAETVIKQRDDLRQQLATEKEEITLDEQRVADLMDQVGELSNQLASRDAEVAKWKDAYLKVVERIHMVGGYQDQSKERESLHKQVTLLRDALLTLRGRALYLDFQFDTGAVDETLAATEPK